MMDTGHRMLRRSLNFTVGNVKFFMVHDRKDVAWELGDTQVVIFGHSHQYLQKKFDGRLWLNPGSCGRSRFGGDVTMAVMTVENGSWQGGKNRALNSCNVEKRNIQNTVLQIML